MIDNLENKVNLLFGFKIKSIEVFEVCYDFMW